MNHQALPRLAFVCAAGAFALFARPAEAQVPVVQCQTPCAQGYTCGAQGQCVPIGCNPGCAIGYVCQAGECVAPNLDQPSDGSVIVQEAPPPPPPQQGYGPAPQQPQQEVVYANPQPPPQGEPVYLQRQRSQEIAAPGSTRLLLGFHLGFAGTTEVFDTAGTIGEADLLPSYGINLQVQKMAGRFFLFGVDLLFRSGTVEGFGPFEDAPFTTLAVDFMFGFHYAFSLGAIALDPFVNLGIGFASLSEDDGAGGTNREYGVDVLARVGANVWFSRLFGAYAAFGARSSAFLGVFDETLTITQGSFELGVAFRLGGR
ncbi:MAG: hypothetical protein AAF938_10255 [Myxococcota bacterium]